MPTQSMLEHSLQHEHGGSGTAAANIVGWVFVDSCGSPSYRSASGAASKLLEYMTLGGHREASFEGSWELQEQAMKCMPN